MNVLSVYDGMSCGQIALNRSKVKYENYFASEIKKHAIEVTQRNFPNTKQLGDVRNIKSNILPRINLLIGGSPCQDFSRMNNVRDGLTGDKSSLFFEFLRLKNELNPDYWLLENVVMSDADYMIISEYLETQPVRINSSLVSAQYRDRLYWTNIGPGYYDLFGNRTSVIPQPIDKKINASSIIESGYTDRNKMLCLTARYGERWGNLWTNERYKRPETQIKMKKRYDKAFENIVFENGFVRPLTIIEMERLQTVPEGYIGNLDWVKAANLLGDGWTVDVISHIFNFIE